MIELDLGTARNLLVLGAHCDDIEIGVGGTILRLAAEGKLASVTWAVMTSTPEREAEARASAAAFLEDVAETRVEVASFRDGFLPYSGYEVKEHFEWLKGEVQPDLVLTHRRADAHQDHRLVAELTWNTWRDHLVLEYEIPKWEGDLGAPNLFVPLDRELCERKVKLLHEHFPSQTGRRWFTADTFMSVMRLRGLECNSPSDHAEGLYVRKAIL
jgi:LmbE family N-acetylglucosaminyl deacetylase